MTVPRINVGVKPYTMWDAAKEEWPHLLLSGTVVVVALWVFLAWGRG